MDRPTAFAFVEPSGRAFDFEPGRCGQQFEQYRGVGRAGQCKGARFGCRDGGGRRLADRGNPDTVLGAMCCATIDSSRLDLLCRALGGDQDQSGARAVVECCLGAGEYPAEQYSRSVRAVDLSGHHVDVVAGVDTDPDLLAHSRYRCRLGADRTRGQPPPDSE